LTEIEIQVVAGNETFDVDIENHIVRFEALQPDPTNACGSLLTSQG
jgi:hypothetical protein